VSNRYTRNPYATHDEDYGFMEREMAFKLMAAHALVDPGYFRWLREDPVAAAEHLRVRLSAEDLDYLKNKVQWDTIEKLSVTVRGSLRLDLVTNSW
jgi:hypothetical protein